MPKPDDDRRINFTKASLNALESPAKGRVYYYDTKQPGLSICITAAGAKTFYVYAWASGKPMRKMLGRFPILTVDNARTLAKQDMADVAKGLNPAEERATKRKQERGEKTLRELFDWWMENHAKPHKKPSSIKEDERLFERYLKPWEKRRLTSIKRSDVRTLHATIGKTRKYGANRMLSLVGTMFQKAIDADDVAFEGPNPARGVTRFDEKSRDRFLQADEMKTFFTALDAEPNPVLRNCFYLLILTGARRSNVVAMRWEQINLDRGTWVIPETKSGESQTIHLSGDAVQILRELRESAETTARAKGERIRPWVFPSGRKTSKKGHVGDIAKAWERLIDRSGLKDLRIHDLRRTLGSWQAANGASLLVIGKTLGHKNQATTQIYARMNLDPVKESVNAATAAILAIGKPKPDGEPEQPGQAGPVEPQVEGKTAPDTPTDSANPV